MWRVGVDIGGTFTDGIAFDDQSGSVRHAKAPSTPRDFAEGVLNVIDALVSDCREMSLFVHGTTVGLNSLLQGRLLRLGLVATRGFRDIIELGRGNRVNIYDPLYQYPAPLIPRRMRYEVDERIDSAGQVLAPLDEEEVRRVISQMVSEGAEGIVISFINSYVNPAHERAARRIVESLYPGLPVVCSTDLTREYREHERTCTAIINLGISRDVRTYLTSLEAGLARRGYSGPVLVMQPNGGAVTSSVAKERPVWTLGSTLAGGVIGLEVLSDVLGIKDLIGADMGGTSFDVEVVLGGRSRSVGSFKVRTPASGADGYPVLVPTLDAHSIGAGGGSIAWVDTGGLLHVGPESMGADPGPACYGKGGDRPTVTDANVVLGRLNPEYLLGGKMPIYREYAEAVIQRLARRFGLGIHEMGDGILEIVCNNMAGAIRAMTLRKGLDPRELTLVAFGGAGPLHACRLAEHLGINEVVVPPSPGTFSAWGMVTAPLKHDFVQTVVCPLADARPEELDRLMEALVEEGKHQLEQEGVEASRLVVLRSMDLRYVGQERTLCVPLPTRVAHTSREKIAQDFDQEHQRVYLQSAPEEPKEVVSLRVSVIGTFPTPSLPTLRPGGSEPAAEACRGVRSVYFSGVGFTRAKVYERDILCAGNVIEGPAVIEELTSTTLLPPGSCARVDEYGNLRITLGA